MALLEKKLEVKQSDIPGAGLGLFTTETINKGDKIVEYKGKIKTWAEAKHDDGNFYIFYVNDQHVIDGATNKKGLARFINDAKGLTRIKGVTNNAEFVCVGLRVFVVATKNIPAGSEILVGYGKEYWQVIRKNQKIDSPKASK